MNKVLFVAVHPDDETLGCGGTILKHKAAGDQIYWLVMTAPTINHPCHFSKEFICKREELLWASLPYSDIPELVLYYECIEHVRTHIE